MHGQLKDALKTRLVGASWLDHLPWVMLGIRVAHKDDTNISSWELVCGAPLVLPSKIMNDRELPSAEFWNMCGPLSPLPSFQPGQPYLLQARWVYTQVKYGARSLKFIWAPFVQLYSLAETPRPPSHHFLALGLVYEGPIGQQR